MRIFKRIVKQFVLSFTVLLTMYYGCQKDDAISLESKDLSQQNTTTKTVSASEIPKVMQFLQSKSNSRLEFLVDDTNSELGMHRSHEENLSMTTMLIDQIKMVTNSYGKSNYTFKLIEQGDKTGVYFINLVVKEYRDELYMYIVKYVPNTTWLQTHHISRDFNDFTGYMYFYSEVGTYIGSVDMVHGIAVSNFQKHPCEGETAEMTDNESSSSSSNNGSGGGGAIGSDCYVYLEWYECNGNNSDEEHSSEECGGSSGTGSGWTLVIICEAGIRSMRDTLRHPCDGGSTIGGGTNTNRPSCEEITGTTCEDIGEIIMEWDANCNCVEAQTIENTEVSVSIPEKDDDCDTSKEDLKKVFPNMSDADASTLAHVINNKGMDFGIDSDEDLWHFLSQAGHETGGFNTLNVTESTYWTTASKLADTYTKFTMDSTLAATNNDKYYAPDYLQNSSGVANIAMCCEFGNGNVASGDGYKYRGRGLFQLTWKDNYSAFKTWYNNKYDPDIDPVTTPGIIASNDTLAILSGLWYYKTRVDDKINVDSTTTVDAVTIKINGKKKKGIADRKERFQKTKDSIKCQ